MKKILVVEDSEMMRREVVDCLRNNDYEVLEALNGDEAYAILSKQHAEFSLVVLDFHLPGMNGVEVLRKLARERISLACPIVMITSEFEAKGSEIKDLNIMAWIIKPINKIRLQNLVAQIFEYLDSV
jgi:CheY-like chemotaxis protein